MRSDCRAIGTDAHVVGSYAYKALDAPSDLTPALDGDLAVTGAPALDLALGGLFWGDNVVFEVAHGVTAEPFYRAIAATDVSYDNRLFVRLADESPAYQGFDVVDAGAKGELAQPAPLLRAVAERCRPAGRNIVLFDGLDIMAARWGTNLAARFFTRCCPQLLELGAIAYWSLPATDGHMALRRAVEQVTQCIFVLDETRLRVAKAEGRPPGVEGSLFSYRERDGLPLLTPEPVVGRIGAALRAARVQRDLSQSDLARLALVSPSAISQAERGRRGLSLETLLTLSTRLNLTLDELLGGEIAPGYRLGRRPQPARHDAEERAEPLPLLDDPEAGLRAYLVRLRPRGSAEPHVTHKGVELVAVASGLVQVLLSTGRPVLRAGEALLVDDTQISGWRNLAASEAAVFWVLRDARRDA
jgi:transcriptional regulator with XRE-family HTH domain